MADRITTLAHDGLTFDVTDEGPVDGEPVLVRDGRLLLVSFHPELTDDLRVHALFMTMVEEASSVGA